MASGPITSWQIGGEKLEQWQILFSWASYHWGMVIKARKLKDTPWKNSFDKHRQCMKKQRHHFADKGLNSQSYRFSCSHVQVWELNHKEGRVPKDWCFWTVVLEKTLESPLKSKEIKLSILKESNPEYLLEGLMLKQKLQYFGYLMQRADSLKSPDDGKDWRQKEKRTAEDEMVGWHHWCNAHEFEQTLGGSKGHGSLGSYRSWGHKESDMTQWLNNKSINSEKVFHKFQHPFTIKILS